MINELTLSIVPITVFFFIKYCNIQKHNTHIYTNQKIYTYINHEYHTTMSNLYKLIIASKKICLNDAVGAVTVGAVTDVVEDDVVEELLDKDPQQH
jgi:hypothetical protein